MLLIKKIDFFGQLLLSALMILSVPFLFAYGFLMGLFVMGCWQLLSAAANTGSFISLSQRKQIALYWKLCITDLIILFISWRIENLVSPDILQFIFGSAVVGAVLIAIYYLKIYKKLIDLISLRNELDGLTKSKHRS